MWQGLVVDLPKICTKNYMLCIYTREIHQYMAVVWLNLVVGLVPSGPDGVINW
jgi:hypothetical protein